MSKEPVIFSLSASSGSDKKSKIAPEEKTTELVVVDVSKYKKIKRQLRESEERYRLLFENAPLGVYRTTPEGRVLDANPAFVKMLGYKNVEEFSGKNLNQLCMELKYPRSEFRSMLEQTGELKGFEVRCLRRDGSPIYIRENAKLIRDESGKIISYEGTIEEITEKKVMEELIQKRSREMEVLNRILISGNKTTRLQDLLEVMSDYVMEMLKFDMACVYLVNLLQQKAQLKICRGLPPAMAREIEMIPLQSPPFRDVFLHGKSIYTNSHLMQTLGEKFLNKSGWLSMAAIPLLAGDRVIGSLHVASQARNDFLDDDKAILELIGKEAGTLISKIHAENALRESEEFYRKLVETSPDIIVFISLQNEIIMINRQFLEIAGLRSEEEIRGSIFTDFLPADERERFEEKKALLLEQGKLGNVEFNLSAKDRRLIPIEINASMVSDAEGKVRGLIVFGRDIAARKLAEKELKENEQIFRRTFEAIPDPAYLWLRLSDGKIVLHLANTAARQISQNRIQDYLGLELEEIYIDYPQIVSRVKEAFTGAKSISEVILFKERSNEEERWLLTDYVKTSENNLLWITKDITERKLSEEKVLNYQEQLRSLTSTLTLAEERERRKIAVSLHDHIGQQLAFSKIKVETLDQSVSDPKLKQSVDEIRQLLERTIEDTRSLIFELSPPILYELGFDAAMEWLAENIQKRFDLGMKIAVRSDCGALEEDMQILLFQVVRELLVNAAKHSQAKSAWVDVKRDKTYIQIEVGDDGIGFEADRFLSQKNGSGYGFFSIRERIKHVGGILKVESKARNGTRVFLKVPLHYQPPL